MVMHFKDTLTIEDPRNHPAETVVTLRNLLLGGARVNPDPKRSDFYELENGCDVYYIYISPVTSQVLLLATWKRNRASAAAQGTPGFSGAALPASD
jgi:hypothetical protein